ncbi:tubulin/FtsZ family protein [Halobaculum sp. D14]|uniref:tubulin/FtsZ family protein n=1 Tax=Halobaculum sp. D14 TaxID=3421642 RepID=UPI003EB7B016
MKLALLGAGNAGTRIVDRLVTAEADTGVDFTAGNVLAFDTTTAAFAEATALPDERQILLGDTHPAVTQPAADDDAERDDAEPAADGDADGAAGGAVTDAGVGGDPDAGAAVATDELPEIRRALDLVDETEVDAAMLVAGLGGGTGSGVGSVLLEEMQAVYECPVYVLGALPAETEPDRRALTAARAVRTMVPLADTVFPVDNEAWRAGADDVSDRYREINDEIATRIVSLFAIGESGPATASEIRIDPADVQRTLDVGGLATIGQATIEIDVDTTGWLTRLLRQLGLAAGTPSDGPTDAATIKRLVRQALESRLTLPCEIASADRVLLLLSGPPEKISRKGFETGRYLLEQETDTVEVLAGDEPRPDASTITATVLLANVTDVPRIDDLQQRALAARTDGSGGESADGYGFDFEEEPVDEAAGEAEFETN